jgi:hypothetical protein
VGCAVSARQTVRGKAPARPRGTGAGRPRPARRPARRSASGKSTTRVVQVSGIGSLITLNLFGRGSSGRGGLFTRLRRVATSAGKAFGRSAMTAAGAARGRSGGAGGSGGGGGRSFDDFAASRPDLFDDPTDSPTDSPAGGPAGDGDGDVGTVDDVDQGEPGGGDPVLRPARLRLPGADRLGRERRRGRLGRPAAAGRPPAGSGWCAVSRRDGRNDPYWVDRVDGKRRRLARPPDGMDFPGWAYFDRWGEDRPDRELGLQRRRRRFPSGDLPVRVPLWWRIRRLFR